MTDEPRCEVCGGPRTGGGVAAMPGIAMSIYYCGRCLADGRTHPYWALVANTAMIGGLEHAADWWSETVMEQLPLCGVDEGTFRRDVREGIERMIENESRLRLRDEIRQRTVNDDWDDVDRMLDGIDRDDG